VALGGYHLGLRESERFKSRGVPRWAGVIPPARRSPKFPFRQAR
jgi:hypothetical protein